MNRVCDHIDRREFLRITSGAIAATALGGVAIAETNKPLRIGFIGVGPRGQALLNDLLVRPEIEISCLCDIDTAHLTQAISAVEKARGKQPEGFSGGPHDYRRMLERDFDAVVIATPPPWHAAMAIDSMKSKKFVGSEVPACVTVDECWELIATQKKTGTGYMMLENYIYTQPAMQVLTMVQKGVFGELTYAEGSYIHDVRNLKFNKDGSLTWRGEAVAHNHGNVYPTHAMGPVCRWLGINRDDHLVSLVAMDSRAAASHEYAVRTFGENSPAAKVKFVGGDVSQMLIHTAKGRMIEIHYDTSSARPPGQGKYALQGTRGAYESSFGLNRVYVVEAPSSENAAAGEAKWEELSKYTADFEHPYWKEHGADAVKGGHNGGDYFVLSDFLQAVRTGRSPVDVVDAVTWSVVRPLSAESIRGGNKSVSIPDFTASGRRTS